MQTDALFEWQSAIVQLPDRTFFELIRLYLGKITTPFNKQRLVEKLSGFLCKKDIQHTIVQGLSYADICVLTAIHILPFASKEALIPFLPDDPSLYAHIINMEERLLIYRTAVKESEGEKIYKINPILYDVFKPLLNEHFFFIPEKKIQPEHSFTFADDIILAGFYTFFLTMPDVLKKDGSFKQKALTALEKIFPDFMADSQRITFFCNALLNLGLVVRSETLLIPQEERWKEFFTQSPFERKMYLAAAVYGRVRRSILHARAQILADFLAYLETGAAYSSTTLKRIYYHTVQKTFAMLQIGRSFFSEDTNVLAPETLLESAQLFGFLQVNDGLWYRVTGIFSEKSEKQAVILSPSFELTLLPNSVLADVFPILSCLEPVSIQTTGRFEITQAACARAFEHNITDTLLITSLQKATHNTVTQNIIAHITDWYEKHTAVGLYNGLILTVSEKKRPLFKQNALLHNMIYKELADGIFLLNSGSIEAVQSLLKKADIHCTFYKAPKGSSSFSSPLAAITVHTHDGDSLHECYEAPQQTIHAQEIQYASHIKNLKSALDDAAFSPEHKRMLCEKIERKLIICKEQLTDAAVENTVHEISGLDFLGKVHTATTAMNENKYLEIYFDNGKTQQMTVGLPIHIEKNEYDAILILQPKGATAYEHISLARISKMIMIKESLFL